MFNTLGAFLLDYGKWLTLYNVSNEFVCSIFCSMEQFTIDSLLILYLYVVMIIFGVIAYQYAYFFGSLNLLFI